MLPFLTASRPKNSEHLNTQCKIIEWLVRLMAGGLGYGWYAEVGRGRKRGVRGWCRGKRKDVFV